MNNADVETLHFESDCLKESNRLQLHLHCSLYEHIEIIRVIYGYSKQRSIYQCQFSIYDCIQDGKSSNILLCNGKQICSINLTKNEILSTATITNGVPACFDFNYVQVNFACVSDAKDICDSWKDEQAIIHLSHTRSKDKQYKQCQCKVRSSLSNGQVLLHAREINRQFASTKNFRYRKISNTDCKKTTYLEITTDRSERKCMDNLPSDGNALFGSGSHNFTLNYARNDPFSELYFYFELKARPIKRDHYVQITCNWDRRTTTTTTTTTTTIRTTSPVLRKRKSTTISMSRGRKLSRLKLIRHPPISEDELNIFGIHDDINDPLSDIDEIYNIFMNTENNNEEENLHSDDIFNLLKSKRKKIKETTMSPFESATIDTLSIFDDDDDDDEWSRILPMTSMEALSAPSEPTFSFENEAFLHSTEFSTLSTKEKSTQNKISTNQILIICLPIILIIIFILFLHYLKLKRPDFISHLKTHIHITILFCCEISKLLFSSSDKTDSISSTPTNTSTKSQPLSSFPISDYQSSEYYTNDVGNNFRTTESIYEYNDDELEDSEYTTNDNRYDEDDTC